MRLDWRFRERTELEHGKPPSVWIAVTITLLVFVIGLVITVLTWGKGQSVVSAEFFMRALLVPLAVSGFLCPLVYARDEDDTDTVYAWNYLCARSRVRWQAWSQECVAVLESVTLTPEKDLAERMLGLEGSEPRNEGKTLPLAVDEATNAGKAGEGGGRSGSRHGAVLERLITPFVPFMERFAAHHTFVIVLQTEDDEGADRLRILLRNLNMSHIRQISVEQTGEPLDAGLIHQWLNEKTMPDFCLVLACQLHQYGQEARYSEEAVGLLLAPQHVMKRYRDELKPQAYLFQPISAAPDSVPVALRGMLKAQSMSSEYIRHLWLSALPKPARHAAEAASEAAALKAAVHDVDLAIGKPGPASALLAQALAAEMVQHGQGPQLVATSGGVGILLNLVGTQMVSVPAEPDFALRYLRPLRVIAIASMFVLIGMVFSMTDAPGGLYPVLFAVFILVLCLEAWGAQGRYEAVETDFNGRSQM